jgi:hypothetical protein
VASERSLKPGIAANLCLVAVIVSGAAGQALAWGSDGHRIIGEIAYRQLEAGPKQELRKLLPQRGRYRTLYEAATWADTFARQHEAYDYLKPQHFINADPEADTVDVKAGCGEQGCVVSAVIENACMLRRGSGKLEKRREALFLLAHFVGDVHQPLHVAHPDGRGGNRTNPHFLGERTKLHALWDSGLIRHQLRSDERWDRGEAGEGDPDTDSAAWNLYAGELAASLPSAATIWKRQLDPGAWANESLKLARQYTFGVTSSQRLAEPYYDEVMPVLARRLQQAGVRLASLLDAVFSEDAVFPYDCAPR